MRGKHGKSAISVTGGGVALVYNEVNFHVEEAGIDVPEGIEAVWAIMTPRSTDVLNIKKILVAGIYISPRSKYKQETIEHIIETMHSVQSRYEHQIRFFIAGDFNKVDTEDLLESNGALQQICSVETRNKNTLELILTCMATLFHPPTTQDPLQQDENTTGKPSDHKIVIVAPKANAHYKQERHKKTIHIRQQPQSKVAAFMSELGAHSWPEVFSEEDPNIKALSYHNTIMSLRDKHFPVKSVKMSSLDKKWFTPTLKVMYNEMQNEFFKNRKSQKWKSLRSKFRKSKKKACKKFYKNFVSELKVSNPSKYFKMAKEIGASNQTNHGDIKIECLENLSAQDQVQTVAESMAEISNQYSPIDLCQLPAYLPAQEAPQIELYKVYKKIQGQKKTRSTLDIDLPANIRKEAAEFLAEPLTNIFNTCLREGKYPTTWKFEWCTPVPKKVKVLKKLNDVRKIASTSDYSKIFESFLVEFIMEDISEKLSKRQYGGRKGVGTEHLLVTMVDRIKRLLEDPENYAVVLSSYDWKGAFDRLDPTIVALKLIKMNVRSSIITILIDFLKDRKMQLKMNQKTSSVLGLVGGGPQGSLIGQILYIIGSDDVAQEIKEEDKFKYVDDLSTAVALANKNNISEYDFIQHVASDIRVGQRFLAPSTFETQNINNSISLWTETNKMKLNEAKSNYMIVTNVKEDFATRLWLNTQLLERQDVICHLGLWISQDLSWSFNTSQICKKAYSRMKMLSKLKYVGTSTEDLIHIYTMHIRSTAEYCSIIFQSSLSEKLSRKIESIQKTS
jgi:hypothetical protein